jgi:hypothetical protein
MKSEMVENRYFIECSCGCPDHKLTFDAIFDEEDKFPPVYEVGFVSDWGEPFYKRIWMALKFIFKRMPYYVSSTVVIDSGNVKQLEEIVNKINTTKLQYEIKKDMEGNFTIKKALESSKALAESEWFKNVCKEEMINRGE